MDNEDFILDDEDLEFKEMLDTYEKKFGALPPLVMNMSYHDPLYKKLIKDSLLNDKEITLDEVKKEIEK